MLKAMKLAKKLQNMLKIIKPMNLPTACNPPLLLLLQNVKTTYISHQ